MTDAECPVKQGLIGYCRKNLLHNRCFYDACTKDSQCEAPDGGPNRCVTTSHPWHCEGQGAAM